MTRRNFFRNSLSALAAVAIAQRCVREWVRETVIESPQYTFESIGGSISEGRTTVWRFTFYEVKEAMVSVDDFKLRAKSEPNPNYVIATKEYLHYELRNGKFVRV